MVENSKFKTMSGPFIKKEELTETRNIRMSRRRKHRQRKRELISKSDNFDPIR